MEQMVLKELLVGYPKLKVYWQVKNMRNYDIG
jgi:hypothetical protein